jgi:LPXTG-motif cell wall-anchored protein
MRILKAVLFGLVIALFGATVLPGARADQWNKKTVITFSQPIEIPGGQILPAGTYTFKLMDSPADRNIVQIFDGDNGVHVVATILAINNYRLQSTDQTVVTFAERPADQPVALKAWFYPGDNFGQEFVYPRSRAIQLAVASDEPVPAIATDNTADLRTAPIVAVTPERQEVPLAQAIETTPPSAQADVAPAAAQETTPAPAAEAQELPKTASTMPLIALLGLVSLGLAFSLKRLAG